MDDNITCEWWCQYCESKNVDNFDTVFLYCHCCHRYGGTWDMVLSQIEIEQAKWMQSRRDTNTLEYHARQAAYFLFD